MTKLKIPLTKLDFHYLQPQFHVCFFLLFNSPYLLPSTCLCFYPGYGGRDTRVQVSVNDYLDIYCPHYNTTQRESLERVCGRAVHSYHGQLPRLPAPATPGWDSKRWECNRPHAPHAPIKFSEKFQRYSAFSLGLSTPTHHHGHSCLRLRVYVCCSTVSQADDDSSQTSPDYTVRPNIKIHNLDGFNPEVPKLEKSVSGSSPSRDRLLLTVAMLLVSTVLLS
uniref:Ephrin-A3a n=1 Tax=Seriola dumerili TaxID=41447 RepID=A0A3B4V2A1_SERDU